MKRSLSMLSPFFITLALVATPSSFAQPHSPLPNVIERLEASPSDIQLVEIGNDVWVERLTGVAALAHLNNLRSRRPEAFSKSGKSLRERGFKRTDKVYVERTLRLASSDSGIAAPGIGLAQTYSEQNSSGEIVITSWSDGNDNTWEGEVYMEVYATNDASIWEGQIDASTTDHEWIYYTKTWENPDGPLQQQVENPFVSPQKPMIVAANMSAQNRELRNQYSPAGWLEWAYCWRKSVVAWCSGGAIMCLASNGGWAGCWGATCTGVLVGAGIQCY